MKIALATIGSRGDIQPYIALADALNRSGHKTFIATLSWAKSLIESYGLVHKAVGPDIDMNQVTGRVIDKSKNNNTGFFEALRFMFNTLRDCHEDFMNLFSEADLIIGHGVVGISEAEMLNKPYVISSIEPMGLPKLKKRTGFFLTDYIVNLPTELMMLIFGRPYLRFRQDIGAPKLDFERATQHPYLALVADSKLFIRENKQWKNLTKIVGYFLIDTPAGYQPHVDLLDFLETGKTPIFISVGSMAHKDNTGDKLLDIFIEGVSKAGERAIILMPGLTTKRSSLPENIFMIDHVPYPWLFKKISLVIHHFGFGTTAEVLKAGLPSIPIPHIFDQKLRSKKMYRMGFTAQPLDFRKLNPEKLARAISQTLSDRKLHGKVLQAQEVIQNENALSTAVELINKHFRIKNI